MDKQLSFCLLPHSFLWSRMTALRNFALQQFFGPTHAIPCEPQWEVRKCSPVFLYSPAAQAVIVISDAPRKQEKVAAAFNKRLRFHKLCWAISLLAVSWGCSKFTAVAAYQRTVHAKILARRARISQGCLVLVGTNIELDTVGRKSVPYRWRPCGVTWDSVPEQSW